MNLIKKLEEYTGAFLLLVIFGILLVQIISRLFNVPIVGTEELSRLIFTYASLLGISIGVKKQQHIFIDFITNFMSERVRKITYTCTQFIIWVCLILFIKFGFYVFNDAFFTLDDLGISEKWLYAPLPFLSILVLIRFIEIQYQNVKHNISYISGTFFILISVLVLSLIVVTPDIFSFLDFQQYVDFGEDAVYVALIFWLIIMFLGVPVGWSLFISSVVYFSLTRWEIVLDAAPKLIDSLNSFTLLSVPFFILTGVLMNTGGITERIFHFAKAMLGHHIGGMGHVNIGASLIFSGMSGSALADAGGLGQLEIKAMRDAGYDDDICGGITAASCIIGPLVPPSIAMIIYGVIANESIAKLFVAGFVPGVLITIALMIMNYFVSKKRGYKPTPKASQKERWEAFKSAIWAILTPIIIIGGIFSGYFTPTEAAVIAALYSMIIGFFVYKELTLKILFDGCIETIAITGVTVLMVMTVTFFGDMIAREQVAMRIAEIFVAVADSQLGVLVMINLLLLFLGMFIDALALQFLVLPMLIPIAIHFGIDLVFFGVLTTLNMMIGILTPPMGMALFVVARVGNMTVSTVTKGVIPFIIPIFITLVLITIFPQIITFIPNLIMP
ncbi:MULTISPECIES: TRAP transporter large permease subunit [Pasteurellaceae]|uniref:TRAP transporter large permease subunit n=1 Tax=Pasteurella atlantica TaxID=2827233 RepID=A0AAW8CJ55_9PAST|nr:TRAP transporter large permease subunit [Pasteurella atlantica]MBR0574143.1 TRAP transporter large permease subunit [Pasteurella atlantica]MDP8040046.1 TRAP transporter large permease subunit [Pasteurella atlantica]MDP8042145.1 TRAP transporter large permease subunit [Pasteurella atlantica]MDP8044354.1 TRAP transporter large permease subunit [Pasteurella atlantica]MDP8046405.1 TRAP transporter large permease subunit [Pasteurella atlantica]